MDHQRPDPDELSARVREEETKERQGKPMLLFGARAGVGKTAAMLEDAPTPQLLPRTIPWSGYLRALVVVIVCTLLGALMLPYFDAANIIMVYLLGNVIVAMRYGNRYGNGPSTLSAILSVLAYDYFLVPPYLTFHVSDGEYLITFAIMLIVTLTISRMTIRIQEQAESARERERRTANLYEMSREFSTSSHVNNLALIAISHIEDLFDCEAIILLPDEDHELQVHGAQNPSARLTDQERGVIRWVYDHGQSAGWGTQTLPASAGFYLPLTTSQGIGGVLGLYPRQPALMFSPDQLHLLETFANQAALAIERERLADETEQAQVQIEAERMRNLLLSSVSHELRTPLASITGAASGLLQHRDHLDEHSIELAQIAYEEAERLNRIVSNLLEMSRLESGNVHITKEWQPLEEVVGTTLLRLDKFLKDHLLRTDLPESLPLVPIDSTLIEQVLVNLLENATKYTPPQTEITLSARYDGSEVVVEVADRGPGFRPGDEVRIFDKFYRARPAIAGGVGLGLAICRTIIEAHGGRIWAANRPEGGATFSFTLPLDGDPPRVLLDDEVTNQVTPLSDLL